GAARAAGATREPGVPREATALAKGGARADDVAPTDTRLKEREEQASQKLQRAQPGPAANVAPPVPPPAAPSERVLEADRMRHAAPRRGAEAPVGFAAAPVRAPKSAPAPAAAATAAAARKTRGEDLDERRAEPAQAPAASKDLQAQSAAVADK